MRKTLYFFTLVIFVSSCSVHRSTVSNSEARRNNLSVQKYNRESIDQYTPLTSLQYIARYKNIAIQQMDLYGIPASITLAQGLYESASGNSELARYANNHFGIKCTSDWKGKRYYKDDDHKNDSFRVYDSPGESFRDHSLFLKRKNYAALFKLDPTDYRGWAYGLKQAGYATNPRYPEILIGIIERYDLEQYDGPATETANIEPKDTVAIPAGPDTAKAPTDTLIQNEAPGKIYTVQQGDTLYNISKRFGLTVDDLKAMNNLEDNIIRIGQKLVVVK